jgi:protease-4
MSYPRILATLRSSRWAIQPASLQAIYDSLGAHLRGAPLGLNAGRPATPEVLASLAAATPRADEREDERNTIRQLQPGPAAATPPSPIAVIAVHGIIGKHLSSLETMCGGCDLDEVEAEIKEAMADGNTRAIVLDFNSPGGVVTGVPELAEKIRAWSADKPIFAFTDSLCASAAYWLASACSDVVATKTADLGSIGVYIAMVDDSEWWNKEGLKLELIKAGEFKAMGISGKSLSDAERALLQSDVDTIYAMFTADVRTGRPGIADEVMQGQTFLGQSAVDARLASGLVPDLPAMIALVLAEIAPATP